MTEKIIVPLMFGPAKEAIAAYKAEALQIDQEEQQLLEELDAMTTEMAENAVAAEGAAVEDRVQYRIRSEELSAHGQIIRKVLDELKDERDQLKLKYVPIYREALNTAGAINRQFSATEIVDRYIYDMFVEITEISQQMYQQYREVATDLDHIFRDDKVMEENRGIQYHYTQDTYKPEFWHDKTTVLHKQDVFYALSGHMPSEIAIKKPKEAVSND